MKLFIIALFALILAGCNVGNIVATPADAGGNTGGAVSSGESDAP